MGGGQDLATAMPGQAAWAHDRGCSPMGRPRERRESGREEKERICSAQMNSADFD
jgi:hypothetical protein